LDQEELSRIQIEEKETRLWELYALKLMFKCEMHDIYCEMHEYFPFCLNFCVSGKFPLTAYCQATYHGYANFGFLKRNHLAIESWPPGDTRLQPISGFFLINCLAVMNTR